MTSLSDDRIPLTHLSSKIKQESSVFVQPRILSTSFDKGDQQWEAPKPPPRTKSLNRIQQDGGKEDSNDNRCDASSEDSTKTITIHRTVVSAEVHSSRSRLLLSSEEDVATVKSKLSVLKSSKARKSRKTNKGRNLESSVASETDTKTTFINKKIAVVNNRMSEGSAKENNVVSVSSQRRLSSGSYTLEKPTFPLKSQQTEINEIPTMPVIKTPVPLPRRKKSKENKLQDDNSTVSHKSESEVIKVKAQEEIVSFQNNIDTILEDRPHRKKKKKKHHAKKEQQLTSDSDHNGTEIVEMSVFKYSSEDRQEELVTESQKQTPSRSQIALDEKITGITIHRSDCLIPDELVTHPLVRVHIVDMSTGEYLKKSDPKRPLSYQEENTEYILPMMTHPYDFREHRSVIPHWEELLVFNEKIEHFASASTLLLFEIVDFVDFVTASSRYKHLGSGGAWHCVAWAFLKLFGANSACNLDKEVRLQLYKPKTKKNAKNSVNSPSVYNWWSTGCDKYKGTMYVTVAAVTVGDLCLTPSLRSSVVLQKEESSASSVVGSETVVHSPKQQEVSSRGFEEIQEESEQEPEPVVWSRLPSQSCKLPNKQLCTLPAGTAGGSMTLQFSYSGLFLACGTTGNILVFTLPHWKLYVTLRSHQGLVYSVRWSKDDNLLISASADCTACIWNIKHKKSAPMHVLPHPSFVYCADFVHHLEVHAVVTGCYDGVVRLWCQQKLVYEARGHAGFISALCFTTDSAIMITGDSVGAIIMWKISSDSIMKLSTVTVRELKGIIINNLVAHPGGNRLLVHSRDSLLRMVDIATGAVIQWFQGCVNERLQSGSWLTPCGGMVLACSEDGALCVWDSNTSTQLAMYMSLLPPGCGTVHYHPHEHMAAVSSYSPGSCAQIILIGYDRSVTGKDIGLKIMESSTSLVRDDQGTESDMRKLFGDGEKSQTDITMPAVPNIGLDTAARSKKKTSKPKGIFLNKKSKLPVCLQQAGATNLHDSDNVLSCGTQRHVASKTKVLPNDSDDSTSLQTVKNMKISGTPEGVEDKRLRDIIRRMDRVLLAAMPSNNA